MSPIRAVPTVPGWIVKHPQFDEPLVAHRVEELTPYQAQYGCVQVITATVATELEALCIGQIVLAAMVGRAEALMRITLEASTNGSAGA